MDMTYHLQIHTYCRHYVSLRGHNKTKDITVNVEQHFYLDLLRDNDSARL